MRIRDVMTRNPITVDPDTLVLDARKIMKQSNIRRLPVVEKGKLVGIITQHDLLEASPSPATSLSIHELNYLLSKMKVKEIMKKNPLTLTPDTPFEEALKIGQEKKKDRGSPLRDWAENWGIFRGSLRSSTSTRPSF